MTSKAQLEQSYKSMANWGLVLSILSWLILGIILAPAGFIMGAKSQKSKDASTRITGTIAMIVSGIGLALFIIGFMVGLAAVSYR